MSVASRSARASIRTNNKEALPASAPIVPYINPIHTLTDFLQYVDAVSKERQYNHQSDEELYEKIEKVFQTFRQNNRGIYVDATAVQKHVVGVLMRNERTLRDDDRLRRPRGTAV